MNDKKIFLVERELHSIKKVYAKILKEVELTPEEIELLKFELNDKIKVLNRRDKSSGFTDSKKEITSIEIILKKLEGLK